jgi:hypothetical protein
MLRTSYVVFTLCKVDCFVVEIKHRTASKFAVSILLTPAIDIFSDRVMEMAPIYNSFRRLLTYRLAQRFRLQHAISDQINEVPRQFPYNDLLCSPSTFIKCHSDDSSMKTVA